MNLLDVPRAWQLSDPTRWYVVFCSSQEHHWWDHIFRTRPGFSHVYAMRYDGFNWLLFNPGMAFTEIAIIPITSENALASLVEDDATIVEVEAFRQTTGIRGRWWNGPMTCVEQVKALLGLQAGRVWTPWQLYRYLIKDSNDGQNRKESISRLHLRYLQKAKDTRANTRGARARRESAFRAQQINP